MQCMYLCTVRYIVLTYKMRRWWEDLLHTHPPLISSGYQRVSTIRRNERLWTNCPLNYRHLWKARRKKEKGYLRKCNHHKANEPFGPHSSPAAESWVKMYCRRLEQVLFVNASEIKALWVTRERQWALCVQLKALQVWSLWSNIERSTV